MRLVCTRTSSETIESCLRLTSNAFGAGKERLGYQRACEEIVVRILALLALVSLTACGGAEPVAEAGPEAGADTGPSSDAASPVDAGQQAQDAAHIDASSPEAGLDAGQPEAGMPDAGPPETCAAELEGQATLCLEISSAQATPLPEHFSGLLVQDYRSGWQPWDARYIDAAKRFLPGFLGLGAVYSWDWHSGSIPMSNVDVHQLKANKYNQTIDFHKVIRGKGFIKVDDYARTAAAIGAKLVLEANVRTSARYAAAQVESIRAYAEHVARHGYPVLYWKLSSEPVYWSDANWCDQGERPCTPFHQGGDGYAADMKPFFDAIAAGYAAAGQSVPPRVVHHTEGGHTARQRRFDGLPPAADSCDLGPADSLDARLPLVVNTSRGRFRVLEHAGRLLVHSAVCPHRLGPLEDCALKGSPGAPEVACPWHGYRFDVATGLSSEGRRYRLAPAPQVRTGDNGRVRLVWPAGD